MTDPNYDPNYASCGVVAPDGYNGLYVTSLRSFLCEAFSETFHLFLIAVSTGMTTDSPLDPLSFSVTELETPLAILLELPPTEHPLEMTAPSGLITLASLSSERRLSLLSTPSELSLPSLDLPLPRLTTSSSLCPRPLLEFEELNTDVRLS